MTFLLFIRLNKILYSTINWRSQPSKELSYRPFYRSTCLAFAAMPIYTFPFTRQAGNSSISALQFFTYLQISGQINGCYQGMEEDFTTLKQKNICVFSNLSFINSGISSEYINILAFSSYVGLTPSRVCLFCTRAILFYFGSCIVSEYVI